MAETARLSDAAHGGAGPAGDAAGQHIVDTLIEERAPHLAHSFWWPLLNPVLKLILGYRRAREMADALAPLSGLGAIEHVSALLHLDTRVTGLPHIPRAGRCILICNHPTGIADGIALDDVVRPVRPDLCYFANADAHRVCEGLIDVAIPVAWPKAKRTLEATKRTLRLARRALEAERPVAIFAAGAMSRRIDGRMQDPEWEHSAVALARKYDAPAVPVHIAGPYSFLFHFFDRFSAELRDITLFHELLNKAGGTYSITIGAPFRPAASETGNAELTRRLKSYVEGVLPDSPDIAFVP